MVFNGEAMVVLRELYSMNEDQVREAILQELTRQAEASPSTLQVEMEDEHLSVNGEIDLDALAMAVIGSMAGGP
jgi:hypothetical protein